MALRIPFTLLGRALGESKKRKMRKIIYDSHLIAADRGEVNHWFQRGCPVSSSAHEEVKRNALMSNLIMVSWETGPYCYYLMILGLLPEWGWCWFGVGTVWLVLLSLSQFLCANAEELRHGCVAPDWFKSPGWQTKWVRGIKTCRATQRTTIIYNYYYNLQTEFTRSWFWYAQFFRYQILLSPNTHTQTLGGKDFVWNWIHLLCNAIQHNKTKSAA